MQMTDEQKTELKKIQDMLNIVLSDLYKKSEQDIREAYLAQITGAGGALVLNVDRLKYIPASDMVDEKSDIVMEIYNANR